MATNPNQILKKIKIKNRNPNPNDPKGPKS